jgi:iron(III) transport system substrate-binding protein
MKNRITVFLILVLLPFMTSGFQKATKPKQVVIYTSLDQIFSEPILKEFEKKTGIKVKAVYDVEAAKTTGLVNRLIAEKDNPQADVFWNSEVGRTLVLKRKGILQPYFSPSSKDIPTQFKDSQGYWTGFAARARIIIVNTNLVKSGEEPESIFNLAEQSWEDEVAIGNPLFGTTATHSAALFVKLGDEKAKEYFQELKSNGIAIVAGNSVVRDRVVAGEQKVGLTDTDDANLAIQEGKPAKIVYPDQETMGTLVIPNTIALIKGAPHAEEGKQLIDYLLSEEVESKLAYSGSMQIPVRLTVKTPEYVPPIGKIKAMDVSYEDIADKMEYSARILQETFLR